MEIQKYEKGNRSYVIESNEANRSTSKNNLSALELSTHKVVEEKIALEKKYLRLKEEYKKLKAVIAQKDKTSHPEEILKEIRDDSLLI